LAVIPNSASPAPSGGGVGGGDPVFTPVTAFAQSEGKAVQSIGQTTAIVIQDAADMLRNISTIEVTAIGAATAAWLATQDPVYKEIIDAGTAVITAASNVYLEIGKNAYTVFSQFE
jgi:hypothetical protein